MITFANIQKHKTDVVTFGLKEIGPYYWVGHCKNGIEYYAGQTFKTPEDGFLKSIKLFSPVVYGSSNATLSIYEFDASNNTWKEKRGESIKRITKALENEWIEFDLPAIEVLKNQSYGFKLMCEGEGMVAIAECPWTTTNPYKDGVEWVGSSYLQEGKFQQDFDFAFEGEIQTSMNVKFL